MKVKFTIPEANPFYVAFTAFKRDTYQITAHLNGVDSGEHLSTAILQDLCRRWSDGEEVFARYESDGISHYEAYVFDGHTFKVAVLGSSISLTIVDSTLEVVAVGTRHSFSGNVTGGVAHYAVYSALLSNENTLFDVESESLHSWDREPYALFAPTLESRLASMLAMYPDLQKAAEPLLRAVAVK